MTANDFEDNNIRLVRAAGAGNTAEVAHLIPISNPTHMFNLALRVAAQMGHVECVKLLIPVSLPVKSAPLLNAVEKGHTQCVRLLIPVTEEICIHEALCVAAQFNFIDCVKLLVHACDPTYKKSLPLQLAVEHNNQQCIDLLYDFSDPHQALNVLKFRYLDQSKKWNVLEQRIENERLHDVLSSEVGEGIPDRKHKM